MSKKTIDVAAILNRAKPLVQQQAVEIQPFGHLVRLPIALSEVACQASVENLNQLLADTIALRDLIVSDIIRANDLQIWFVAEHVVDVPLAQAV
jgi:hypothetical protein